MNPTRTVLAAAALLLLLPCPARSQTPEETKWTEAHFLLRRLDTLRSRIPPEAAEELQARLQRWSGLGWEDRQEIERVLWLLDSLMPHQIREIFADAEKAPAEERGAKVKEVFKRLAAGGELPAPNVQPSVVVVIVGGQVEAGGGLAAAKDDMPRVWNEIRPFGTLVKSLKSMWVGDARGQRIKWLGEFLTGHSINGVIEDGNVAKFRSPTLCDLFRKASGVKARDCWIVTLGDENSNIILDFQEFVRDFQDKYKPTALNEYKLKSIDGYVQDHVLSLRKEGKTAFEIQNLLAETLTPGKIHIDIDFDDPDVQRFLTRAVAEHGGNLTVTEGFLQRLSVRLLQDPVMAPQLAIFRFAGIPELRDEKRPETRRGLMARKAADHDAACLSLWRAFRSNPYYRNLGTFVILHEYGGGLFVGPRIKAGAEVSKQYYLNQVLPTIAKILGYDPDKFIAPCPTPPKKPPIDEIFE